MPIKIYTGASIGLNNECIEVEVDFARSLPAFVIVGLPDTSIQEAKERVRSAIRNSGYEFPERRIVVSLSPADIRKEGSSYDLPIAIAILQQSEGFEIKDKILFSGELSLDGKIRKVNGAVSLAIMAVENGFEKLVVPRDNAKEASLIEDLEIIPVDNLRDLSSFLKGQCCIRPFLSTKQKERKIVFENKYDLSNVKGQTYAKRALEISAAGGHNMLMSGPPGSGKTMLARSVPSILPKMTYQEILDVTRIYSSAGLLTKEKPLVETRPFRSPHHSASPTSLVGGGSIPRPGEVSLAHHGVLFLDEFPEFDRQVLENLRQPMEDLEVQITRTRQTLTFPAKFTLVASMNPCPCGYIGSEETKCSCSHTEISRYQKKISGPLLDRIDIFAEVPRIKVDKLMKHEKPENSKTVQKRVEVARLIQVKRFKKYGIYSNSEMGNTEIKEFCVLGEETERYYKQAISCFDISARTYFKLLKVARTIADLDGSVDITKNHLAEALQYRNKVVGVVN